jgi:hypothetical protein
MIETQAGKVQNTALVTLGVSLFINFAYSFRFTLKNVKQIDRQLVSLTKCLDLLFGEPFLSKEQ